MRIIFDYLQIVFWSITYLLIIYNGFRYKDDNPQMPFIVGALNFAWIYYAKLSVLVGVVGICVFLLNLLYLCICMEHSSRKNKYRRDAY